MTGWLREFRLIPIVLVATTSLLALKTVGLVVDGGFTLGQRLGSDGSVVVTTVPVTASTELHSPSVPLKFGTPPPQRSWMREMFNYPHDDITGSVAATKPAEKKAAEPAEADKAKPADKPKPKDPPPDQAADGKVIKLDQPRPNSPSERALLERLQQRRQELDSRARELDMREGIVKAAEQKIEAEKSAKKSAAKANGGARSSEDTESARFKALVIMYEAMKPKEAAKIFDRLDIKVLLEMASQIKPQRMSEILANMTPEVAERLTMEMAAKAGTDRNVNPNDLPKIDGKPGG